MKESFITAFAAAHFSRRPRQSLLAGLATCMNETNLVQALASGCRPVQNLAWNQFVALAEPERERLLTQWLADDPEQPGSVSTAVLSALIDNAVPLTERNIDRIVTLLDSPRSDVRVAAASVLALRKPQTIQAWLNSHSNIDRDVLRRLCLADDFDLIVPLMNAFGFPSKAPAPTIGFMLTPEWLGDHFEDSPAVVNWLAGQCGYCDDPVTPAVVNLLSSGFSYVTPRMTDDPRMSRIAHRWERRIRAFVWRLLPQELDLQRDDDTPLDVTNPFETDLFLAAVRDADRMRFLDHKRIPPFSHERRQREPSPVCFHASLRYTRRLFLDQPLAWAERWKIPLEQQGEFLFDHARVLLEPIEEARIAADLVLRGRWIASPAGRLISGQSTRRSKPAARPPARTIVLKDFERPVDDTCLSPAANSVVCLTAACGLDQMSVAEWLCDAERRWARLLLPIGIEIQIPRVDPDRFAAWKDALPFLGIPSPNRPEFRGLLEAAFRPARSFHALALGPLLLCRLKAIGEPQDMALHISLQAELADAVRTIAFPSLFIHPSNRLRDRPDWSMARVMSKGFVHTHDDAEVIDPGHPSPRRTEFRLFRVFAEETPADHDDEGAQPRQSNADTRQTVSLSCGFISDLIAVQILASVAQSDCDLCRELFREHAADVDHVVDELPDEFRQLQSSNYFESTGDPRDEELLAQLPIFRCWSAVRQIVRDQDLIASLDLRFRRLRYRAVGRMIQHWSERHELAASEICFADDEIRLILPPGFQ